VEEIGVRLDVEKVRKFGEYCKIWEGEGIFLLFE
jgi:hypothetical protein